MAFTAVASIASTGFAAATAATVLAAVTEIGTALTIVGAVTGSKTLTKFGAVLGVVGGVGGLINSAAGAATSAAASAASSGVSGMDMAADAGMGSVGGNAVSGMDLAADSGMGSAGAVTSPVTQGAVQASDLAPSVSGSAAQGPDALASSATSGTTSAAPTAQAAQTASTIPDPISVSTPADVTGGVAPAAVQTPASVTGGVAPTTPAGSLSSGMDLAGDSGVNAYGVSGAPIKSGSFFSGITDFVKNNKSLVDSGLKLGLGAIKGAADGQFNQARIDMARQQMAYGNSVSQFRPGIINGRISQ